MEVEAPSSPPARICYVASEHLAKISSLLPSNRNRSLVVHGLITALGLLRKPPEISEILPHVEVLRPPLATPEELAIYHRQDYVDYLLNAENHNSFSNPTSSQAGIDFGLEEDCPPFRGLSEYAPAVAGASLAAARALVNGICDVSICWDGGRHHAHKGQASGFCYVNDCVLALLVLKRCRLPIDPENLSLGKRKARILYLDFDLHFSDGVSSAFAESSSTKNPQILTFSLHHASPGFFPVSSLSSLPDPSSPSFDPFTLSLPLHAGASAGTFARVWNSVEHIKDAFEPDFVILQCGADGLAGDPCKVWNWELGGEGGMGWCVQRVVTQWQKKVLLLGGGGYNTPNTARAWAYLTSIACGREFPLDTHIPDHGAFPLYGPSFTLDVPAGNVSDQNSTEYLDEVQRVFEIVAQHIRQRVSS